MDFPSPWENGCIWQIREVPHSRFFGVEWGMRWTNACTHTRASYTMSPSPCHHSGIFTFSPSPGRDLSVGYLLSGEGQPILG